MRDKESVTCESLKNKLLGKGESKECSFPFLKIIITEWKLIDKNCKGNLTRYKTCLKHTKAFLKWKFNISDIDIQKIDYAFLNDFELFLRTERDCNNNSAVKYIKNFGKIIRICIANGWINRDPFLNYSSSFNEVTRVFLNEQEIENFSIKI
jgi:hypothetical protein